MILINTKKIYFMLVYYHIIMERDFELKKVKILWEMYLYI